MNVCGEIQKFKNKIKRKLFGFFWKNTYARNEFPNNFVFILIKVPSNWQICLTKNDVTCHY